MNNKLLSVLISSLVILNSNISCIATNNKNSLTKKIALGSSIALSVMLGVPFCIYKCLPDINKYPPNNENPVLSNQNITKNKNSDSKKSSDDEIIKKDSDDEELSDIGLEWLSDYPQIIQTAALSKNNFNKEIFEKFSIQSNKIFNSLSNEEKEAIKDYTGLNRMTSYIRGYKFESEESEKLRKYVELIFNLINRTELQEDIIVFRGANAKCLEQIFTADEIQTISNSNNEDNINEYLKKLEGKIIKNNGFTSTSTSLWSATNFANCKISTFFIINAKKGINYLPLMNNSICKSEDEVLFNRNLNLKINKVYFKINPRLFSTSCDKCFIIECETVN